ncbi:MAG: aminopeptidase [Oscillospiraceae bacterium]
MSEKKTMADNLKTMLFYEPKNACDVIDVCEIEVADEFCEGYKAFLDKAKTEREAVNVVEAKAIEKGFVKFEKNKEYKAGSKIYFNNRGKSIILAVIGKKSLEKGARLSAAHIDSPRLDLKPNPLYEDSESAFFKTHYYGGIKKYQWTAIPLSLHGVIVKREGTKVVVNIGEDDNDPKFVVTDLLPHLGAEQMKRTLGEGIKGEELNVLIGSRPFSNDEMSDRVKLNIINLLHEKYDIDESDFLSAELEIVPAFKACDIGFDRSLIGAYGHDDRVCAYPAAEAIFNIDAPEYTAITVLTDKEEIGSEGNTGLNSSYLKYFIADISKMQGVDYHTVLSNTHCLSADVNAAFDPTFPDVSEKRNASFINKGVAIMKYTGSRGKSGTSDASAEFMARVRGMLDGNYIVWQSCELGKVDAGGGGTVAMYLAALDMDVVDLGVPVLSMHAPFEVVSKLDVYMAYKAFKVFFEEE